MASDGIAKPLVILPGHNSEVLASYDRLVDALRAHVGNSKPIKDVLQSFIAQMRKATSDEQRLSLTEEFQSELYGRLYVLEEPHDKFREFNRAFVEKRLISFKRWLKMPALKDYFSDFEGLGQKEPRGMRREGSESWWRFRLSGEKEDSFNPNDEMALSALDLINRHLLAKNARLVLLTASPHILKIGRKYRPYKHTDANIGQYSFGDLYLRHPRAYLNEQKIMVSGQTNDAEAHDSNDLDLWLDALLAEATQRQPTSLLEFRRSLKPQALEFRNLTRLADRTLRKKPGLHRQIYDGWVNYATRLASFHSAYSDEARSLFSRYLQHENFDADGLLDGFEKYLRRLTEQSWDEFLFSAMEAGTELIMFPQGVAAQNVPTIFFRGLGAEADRITELSKQHGIIKSEEEVRSLLRDLDSRAGSVDSYVSTLCYALLFAHAGRFGVANLIASRACSIADDLRDERRATQFVSGREAYYFRAVMQRLCSQSRADLRQTSPILERARELTKADSLNLPDVPPKLSGIRIEAESMAAQVSELYFELFDSQWAVEAPDMLEASIRDLRSHIEDLLSTIEDCSDPFVCATARVSLRSSIINGAFILEFIGRLDDGDRSVVEGLLDDHLDDLDFVFASGAISRLSFVDLILTAYAGSFGNHVDPRMDDIHTNLDRWRHSSAQLREVTVMPYDKRRFTEILNLIDQR